MIVMTYEVLKNWVGRQLAKHGLVESPSRKLMEHPGVKSYMNEIDLFSEGWERGLKGTSYESLILDEWECLQCREDEEFNTNSL